MRKVILSMMVSADGSVAGCDGDLEWFRTDADFEDEMLGLLRSVDGMFFGRVAYGLLAAYWPTAGTADAGVAPGGFTTRERQAEFARLMNTVPKIVISRTLTHASWGPSQIIGSDLTREVQLLKGAPGRDLVLFAGARTASAFVSLGLVDEYRLMVHPIVLGRGVRLFQDVPSDHTLALMESRRFSSDVVLLKYRRNQAS